jgi:hypothetical protein
MSKKHVYFFGGGKADGNESMKNLLGGKGKTRENIPKNSAGRLTPRLKGSKS